MPERRPKGIYCLVFENPACTARIGALGEIAFRKGLHVYVGSALGSGGLARLDRHIARAGDSSRKPKWHVDYLLADGRFPLRYAISAETGDRLECTLARALGAPLVPLFGCSDCDCPSHLFFRDGDPRRELEDAFRSLGLVPITTIIMNRNRKGIV